MRRSSRRGSAFVAVIAVLALMAILSEAALALLVSHLSESRRRGDSAYAGELARSGLAWARACIAAGGTSCSTRLTVGGGTIDVTSRLEDEVYVVTSRGVVLRGSAEGPSREATTRVRPPPPAETPASGAAPPTPGPTPAPAEPRRKDDGTGDLRTEEFPRHF